MDMTVKLLEVIAYLLVVGFMYYGLMRTFAVYMMSHDDPRKWARFADSWSGALAIAGSFLLVAAVPMIGFALILILPIADDLMEYFGKDEDDASSE